MKTEALNFNSKIYFTAKEHNKPSVEPSVGNEPYISRSEFCSKEAASAIRAQIIYPSDKIPYMGDIPQGIIDKCSTGTKGAVINKETGERVKVSAKIEEAPRGGARVLRIYDGDKEIGYTTFKIATKEHPFLIGTEGYLGEDGAVYVDYIQNNYKDTYSHTGTLMHRILHELSKQEGHKGKMILDSMDKPIRFHYDSGFVPSVSFNAGDDEYLKAVAERGEFRIITGSWGGSCVMCLDENKMEKLEAGEHCIPDNIKTMTREELWDLDEKLYQKERTAARKRWGED